MARRHVFEGLVTLCLTRIPVQLFPVIAENFSYRVVGWQRNANAETPISAGCSGVDEIVLMAVVHGGRPYIARSAVYRNFTTGHHGLMPLRDPTSAISGA